MEILSVFEGNPGGVKFLRNLLVMLLLIGPLLVLGGSIAITHSPAIIMPLLVGTVLWYGGLFAHESISKELAKNRKLLEQALQKKSG